MTHQRIGHEHARITPDPAVATIVDALERDASRLASTPTPAIPDAFTIAVTRRRWARRAPAAAGIALVLVGVVALALSTRDSTPPDLRRGDDPLVESTTPSAAELSRMNRGRSGERLILPDSNNAPAPNVTAGTRSDSPAAATVVK